MAAVVAVFKFKSNFPDMTKKGKRYPFKYARLVNYPTSEFPNGNPDKKWYIVFYAWSIAKNQLIRKRYTRLNHIAAPLERRRYANEIITKIDSRLKRGFVVADKEAARFGGYTTKEAFDKILAIKKDQLRPSTIHGYENTSKFFIEWVENNNLKRKGVAKLKRAHILAYLDSLTGSGLGNRSRNNHLSVLSTFFAEIKKRDPKAFDVLPTHDIAKLPVIKRKHKAYSLQQMKEIKAEIEKIGDKQLLLFISFIYYLLARPNEIINLKVKNIEINQDRIYIPPRHSKNRTGDYVDIYPPLKVMILQQRILDYPGDNYIFGRGKKGAPGDKKVGAHYFYEKLMRVIKKLKLDNQGYDMYSFKHSGVCNLYLSKIDLRDIQLQCRHKSMTQTMEYLRDLDMFRKKDHFNKVKSF